jgi:phosphotriesterase-related protein
MSLMTVTGPIEVNKMGVVLPHEHMFIDLRNQFTEFSDPEKKLISAQQVNIKNLGRLRLNPYAVKDNLLLDDMEIAVEEVCHFKNVGGQTIIDCTSIGIKRDVKKLQELSQRSGINIVAGSGYYTQNTHPEEMSHWSAEEIADQIVSEFTDGIDGSGIKAGVIGEIGTSETILPDEKKNLLASAMAFQKVNAPMYIHTYPWSQAGLEAIDLLLKNGVRPAKIVICHLDVDPDLDHIKAVLNRGVFVEFDNFGKEFVVEPSERGFAGGIFIRDLDRIRIIKELVESGFEQQLLITNDICLKTMLCNYGGFGYAHILKNIVPLMQSEGLTQDMIDLIILENPKRLFVER